MVKAAIDAASRQKMPGRPVGFDRLDQAVAGSNLSETPFMQ